MDCTMIHLGEDQILELTWSPKEECSQRQMVLFKVEGVVRLQAFLIGKAEVPIKPKKVTNFSTNRAKYSNVLNAFRETMYFCMIDFGSYLIL